jgi:hypothetical protein
MAETLDDPNLQSALRTALRRANNHPDVIGVDYGLLYRGDDRQVRGRGIRFHLQVKEPAARVEPLDLLPREILGVPCDVLEVIYSCQGDPRAAHDPLCPGVSIGPEIAFNTGTLGTFAHDRRSDAVCLLSNWHVLASEIEAARDEGEEVEPWILQPGQSDRTPESRRVAKLLRSLPLESRFDAALATLEDDVDHRPELFETELVPRKVIPPRLEARASMFGRVSGRAEAVIDGIHGRYLIDYSRHGGSSAWMSGFHLVPRPDHPLDEISRPGDSGALWVDPESGDAIGLHFAGESACHSSLNEYALAHPIGPVLDALQADLLEPQN